jgi:hypothetical protein
MASLAVPTSTYAAKQYNTQGKYIVDGYQYPNDLMGLTSSNGGAVQATYGGNYVIFYINVNNESRMVSNPTTPDILVDTDASDRVKKNLNAKEYDEKAVIAARTAAGVGIGGLIGGDLDTAVTGGALGALGAVGIAANTKNSTFSRPQKRLKTTIALHVPNQLSIRYGAGWSDEETFALQALIDGGEAAGRALVDAGKALGNKDTEGAKSAITGGGKNLSSIVANVALSKGPNAGAMSALTGLAPNPMKEQIFKGVDFRTFTMEYQFAPRSIDESNNINNIITAFKYHMHPEYKDTNNFLFLYPSEFDIEYYHGGEENLNIHRHTSCVLTELNVNYTPNGNFSTFQGGRPTQINVTMTFKELTILTKELISQGL